LRGKLPKSENQNPFKIWQKAAFAKSFEESLIFFKKGLAAVVE
jgi:hypothetical protein